MAAKRFHIATPEELRELEQFAKERPSGLQNVIRIWTVTKRRQKETNWDKNFYVFFSGTRERAAEIVRFDSGRTLAATYPVRYNLALRWCETHLREVYE